ncbi:hypothetical protein Gohar_015564 [Gossypium harknessii]|uniref:RNase H type-1 domain-containing protein n=1 Tax=Gossypium harknessii TaxID=34285 RepID=A0A7J9G0M6_9ROSI|nr:hypothetical protein [Gossypium harknessii]
MDTRRILHIPLSRFLHDNYQVWFGDASGEFTVRSEAETSIHALRDFPMTKEIWHHLNWDWSDMVSNVELLEWVIQCGIIGVGYLKFSIPIRRWESKNWSPLEHPLVKINFDAALWESQNRSSSGIVIREKDGHVFGLKMGLYLGFLDAEVEGDALTVIRKIQSKYEDKSEI